MEKSDKVEWLRATRDYSCLWSDSEIPVKTPVVLHDITKVCSKDVKKSFRVSSATMEKKQASDDSKKTYDFEYLMRGRCSKTKAPIKRSDYGYKQVSYVKPKKAYQHMINKPASCKVDPVKEKAIVKPQLQHQHQKKPYNCLHKPEDIHASQRKIEQNKPRLQQPQKKLYNCLHKPEDIRGSKRKIEKPQLQQPQKKPYCLQKDEDIRGIKRKNEQISRAQKKKDEKLDPAISMIRSMFGYNPTKYASDDDDSNMEATFDDIQKEERKSAKFGKKEDAEELKKLMQPAKRIKIRIKTRDLKI